MTRPISAIVERLRDSLGDGSIDDYYVRFFIGDIRAVVERLDACERVVEAARAFTRCLGPVGCDEPFYGPQGDQPRPNDFPVCAGCHLRAALAALDGKGAQP